MKVVNQHLKIFLFLAEIQFSLLIITQIFCGYFLSTFFDYKYDNRCYVIYGEQ